MNFLKNLINRWSETGIKFPVALDGSTGKPSITLMFAYCTFVLTFISAILLHTKPELLQASVFCLIFWCIAFVFYRMRALDKFKIDLDDKSIELEGDDDEEKP